jgi:hypothetical protein
MIAHMSRTQEAAAALVLLAYFTYGVLGLVYEQRLEQFRDGPLPKKDLRWDPARYAPGAEKWLARDRLWYKLRYPVWIAGMILMIILSFALKAS